MSFATGASSWAPTGAPTTPAPSSCSTLRSEQEARELINQLPFAKAGVLSFTYAELLEL